MSCFLLYDIVFLFDIFVDLGMIIKFEYFFLYFSILIIILFDVYFRLLLDFWICLILEMMYCFNYIKIEILFDWECECNIEI